jgi:hypothetical protein
MSTKDKLIERFKKQPNDFTFDELVRLFGILGFTIDNKGKTSGSRFLFEKGDDSYVVYKPHPSNIIKKYVMKQALDYLTDNKFIEKKED